MKLRRFTATSMEEAMDQVRQTLGPDAIIVSTHEPRRGGGVEVTAAIEEDMIPARPKPQQAPQLTQRPALKAAGLNRDQLIAAAVAAAHMAAGNSESEYEEEAPRRSSVRDMQTLPKKRIEPDWARDDRTFDAVAANFGAKPRPAPQQGTPTGRQQPQAMTANGESWTKLRPNWRSAPKEAVVNPTPRQARTSQMELADAKIAEALAARQAQAAQPAARSQPAQQAPESRQRPSRLPREMSAAGPVQTSNVQPQQATTAALNRLSERDRVIAQALDFHSVPRPIAEALFRAARAIESDDPLMALAGALESRIVFAPLSAAFKRPTMMIGPVGAGKTVSVAKIAAKAVLTGKRIDVITTDIVRAGAIAQIETYTNVLEQDLGIEETPDGLADRLMDLTADQPTIIDTPGANPFVAHEMAELALFIAAHQAMDPILAISAGGDAREALEVAQAFRSLGAKRLIVTRVDAARRLGSIVAAADAGLTLCQISTSPYVADGLAAINPVILAGLLINPRQSAIIDPNSEAASR
jgi:flagellar biosynthesis protein FlhF